MADHHTMTKQAKSQASKKKERIELDTEGEFSTIRRANIDAKADSIISDARKENPLKKIKLIRAGGLDGTSSRSIFFGFKESSTTKIPLLTRSISDVKSPTPPSQKKSTTLPEIPAKLPKLVKTDFGSLNPGPRASPFSAAKPPLLSIPNIAPRKLKLIPFGGQAEPKPSLLSRSATPIISPEKSQIISTPQKATVQTISSPSKVASEKPSISKKASTAKTSATSTEAETLDLSKRHHRNVVEDIEDEENTMEDLIQEDPSDPKKHDSSKHTEISDSAEVISLSEGETSDSANEAEVVHKKTVEPDTPDDNVNDNDVNDTKLTDSSAEDIFFDASEIDVDIVEKQKTPIPAPVATLDEPKASSPTAVAKKSKVPSTVASIKKTKVLPPKKSVSKSKPMQERKKKLPLLITKNTKDSEDDVRRPTKSPVEIVVDAEKVKQVRTKLLAKLHGKSNAEPYGLDDKILEMETLIKSVVKDNESHSCVVFGPRNSGKTVTFQAALNRVRSRLNKDEDFIFINVNGMAQDTDKLAVRSIAEQLDSEISRIYGIDITELDVKELLSRKSITNTFANLLKVLDDDITLNGIGVGKIRQPIVFAIDEVDVFANQSRQTLLYNLFDLVENSPTPVCVICFTSKFTFKELLEKRVRSRFSQRTMHFRRLPQDRFIEACSQVVSIDDPQNDFEEEWNRDIEELATTNTSLRRAIMYNHMSSGNIKEFQNQCLYAVAKLSLDEPRLDEELLLKYSQNQAKSSFARTVNSLSDLELSLLVCAARVIVKTDMSWVNLNIVYEEYVAQLKAQQREVSSSTGSGAVASTGFKTWSKEACKHPWETLSNLQLLTLPGSGLGKSEFSSSTFETRAWQVEMTLDELRRVVYTERLAKPWTRL